jgi:Raf kinase inhibitor-like YbhB/YbcL family protein
VTVGKAAGAGTPAGQVIPAADSGEVVAKVSTTPITKASFAHWMAVTAALAKSHGTTMSRSAVKDQVLGFLITSQWVIGEADHLGVGVSEADERARLKQITAKQFPKAAELKQYLASAGESEADLLRRIKIELLEAKISQKVTAGKTATTEIHVLLSGFQKGFETRWRSRTTCSAGYVMEDCSEFKGTRHPPTASGSSSTTSSSSASSSSASSSSASSNASGEVPPASAGSMALSSSAFELNGEIPSQYTCDGTDISPPLQWTNVPAHTAELVLFIIDDSSIGKEGGIRWVVAGLEPSLTGIGAGAAPPAGAIVGLNGSGKATYGGICPPKGKPATIEFVLWALSKKIPLSSGFVPAVAEREYSHSELGSAVTYATYSR